MFKLRRLICRICQKYASAAEYEELYAKYEINTSTEYYAVNYAKIYAEYDQKYEINMHNSEKSIICILYMQNMTKNM
jgi:hypothetical protein